VKIRSVVFRQTDRQT